MEKKHGRAGENSSTERGKKDSALVHTPCSAPSDTFLALRSDTDFHLRPRRVLGIQLSFRCLSGQVQIPIHSGNHRINLVIYKERRDLAMVPLYSPLPVDTCALDRAEIYLETEELEPNICLRKYDPFNNKVIEIQRDKFCSNHHRNGTNNRIFQSIDSLAGCGSFADNRRVGLRPQVCFDIQAIDVVPSPFKPNKMDTELREEGPCS